MGKRIGIYLIGLAINALGIALIIYSAVGAGAWDTVAIGLNQSWGLTIGICTVIIQVFVVLVTGIIERKRLQYESIIAIAIRSIFLDAWIYLVFNHMDQAASWEIQWLYFIVWNHFDGHWDRYIHGSSFSEVSNRWTHASDSQSIPMEYKYF